MVEWSCQTGDTSTRDEPDLIVGQAGQKLVLG